MSDEKPSFKEWSRVDDLIAENASLRERLTYADTALVEWSHEAGWATGHGDTLADIVRELRAQWREERERYHRRLTELEGELIGALATAEREHHELAGANYWRGLSGASSFSEWHESMGALIDRLDQARTALEILVADGIISAGRARELHGMSPEEQRELWRRLAANTPAGYFAPPKREKGEPT